MTHVMMYNVIKDSIMYLCQKLTFNFVLNNAKTTTAGVIYRIGDYEFVWILL